MPLSSFNQTLGLRQIMWIFILACDFHRKESKTVEVDVTPVPSYQEYTNQFKIRLKGHAESRGRLGDSFSELHGGFYIIINPSAASSERFS